MRESWGSGTEEGIGEGRFWGTSSGKISCSGQCPAGAIALTAVLLALSGVEVTGQYEVEKAQFSWIEVTFKNLQLQVRASPEHVVVIRNRRSSVYKWKETLFSVMPG